MKKLFKRLWNIVSFGITRLRRMLLRHRRRENHTRYITNNIIVRSGEIRIYNNGSIQNNVTVEITSDDESIQILMDVHRSELELLQSAISDYYSLGGEEHE